MLPTENNSKIIMNTINQFCYKHGFDNRKAVIFGCTLYAGEIIKWLRQNGIDIAGFIDNDRSKVGSLCSGVLVHEPSWVMTLDKVIVIIASPNYSREMKGQVLNFGLKSQQILDIPVENPQEYRGVPLDEQFEKRLCLAKDGLKKYLDLIDCDTDILVVFPYPGTGDIYLACGFLRLYLEKKGYKNPLLVVSKNSCKEVAQLYGYERISVVSQADIESLLLIWQILGSNVIKIKPALFWGWNTKYYFRNYKGFSNISFIDYFKYDVFELGKKDRFEHPKKKDNKDVVSALFTIHNLVENRTVIIAPYAGSFISSISMETWECIVVELKKKGYTVCTNCYGKEIPIKGTIPIKFEYEIAVEVLEKAGGFIAVRSGLCDVVSSANAKMLVIYESNYLASDIEYFGIKKMGLNEGIVEMNYRDPESFVKVIKERY